jgi:hypothetical protein
MGPAITGGKGAADDALDESKSNDGGGSNTGARNAGAEADEWESKLVAAKRLASNAELADADAKSEGRSQVDMRGGGARRECNGGPKYSTYTSIQPRLFLEDGYKG